MKRTLFLSAIAMLSIGLSACKDSSSLAQPNNYDVLKNASAPCVSPAVAEIRPWSKSGQSTGCYIKHGEFAAAEDGYVHLRGSYYYGRESGIWRWYDRSGAVVKTVDYSSEAPQ
jgi:hypothetical protein